MIPGLFSGLFDLPMLQAVIANRYQVLASYPAPAKGTGPGARRTLEAMPLELASLWARSMASSEQLLLRL